MDFGIGIILLAWILSGVPFAVTCAYIAYHKGRSAFNWLLIGFFAGFFALVAIACIPKIKSKINFEIEKKKILYASIAIAFLAITTIVIMQHTAKLTKKEQILSENKCSVAERNASIFTSFKIQVNKCEASHKNKTMNIWIDLTSQQALTLCHKLSLPKLGERWKMKIYSPFSGNRPIATCTN